MASIRDELQRIKHENHGLEDELRSVCWLCIIFCVNLMPQLFKQPTPMSSRKLVFWRAG